MFLGFEGTGMSGWGGGNGLCDLSHTKSFVWKAHEAANFHLAFKRYFPGPNIQGDNCDFILQQGIDFFNLVKRKADLTRITVFGYSRGAYIAMCFAKYLGNQGIPVLYLGMFDPVSQDFNNVVEQTHHVNIDKVPRSVKYCYVSARSEKVGSRNKTMNYVGKVYESEHSVNYLVCPGSHAAMGGFPNEAGKGDSPIEGYGDPDNPKKFDPRREFTAWYHSDRQVTTKAVNLGLLKHNLIPRPYHNLIPKDHWDWDNKKLYNVNK